jgi:hypothetical protein
MDCQYYKTGRSVNDDGDIVRWSWQDKNALGRVTRLGQFSPFGRLLTVGIFLKKIYLCPQKKYCVELGKNGTWAVFWAIFFHRNI